MKQFNSKKNHLPRFDKILVIQPIAEVYGESNELQLCSEIDHELESHPCNHEVLNLCQTTSFRLFQIERVCRQQIQI